jgi:hypothetical protein
MNQQHNIQLVRILEYQTLFWHPRPALKKSHIENDMLLVFQKQRFRLEKQRFRLDTKSKCQIDREVLRQKQSY